MHNIKPKGRETRKLVQDKHTFEKQRLAARREGFQRHDPNINPMRVMEGALGYQPEHERFHKDVVGEEKAVREYNANRQKNIIDNKRKENIDREDKRWQKFDEENKKEEQRWDNMRDVSKKNYSSVKYDLINLKHKENEAKDKYEYDMAAYHGAQRAAKLQGKSTSQPFNPITGENITPVYVPPKPTLSERPF